MSSSAVFRRLLTQASRAGCRRSATTSSRTFGRSRGMASDAHGSAQKTSSDMPWMMGAGLVTALGSAWILTPPGKKHAHAAAKSATAPLEAAFPVSEHTEKPMDPMTDDEGNEASGEEVSASIEKALDADAPKAAKSAEENAEETTSEAEAESPTRVEDGEKDETSDEKPEVKEKPTERSGTLQNEGESGPTDLGAARDSTKEGKNAPKQAADSSESD